MHGAPVPGKLWASLTAQSAKNLTAMQETGVWSLGGEDPLEKEMATHSSILAWRISWTEEPGGLQSRGLQVSDTTEWLSLHFNSGLIPGQGTWFHLLQLRAPMLQQKVLWATPNTQCSQINKQKHFLKVSLLLKKKSLSSSHGCFHTVLVKVLRMKRRPYKTWH